MQTVLEGTGLETWLIWNKQMQTVGMKRIEDRANVRCEDRFFIFGGPLDQGGDHKGARRRLRLRLQPIASMAFSIFWCLQHVYSLIVQRHLKVLHSWTWESVAARARAYKGALDDACDVFAVVVRVKYISALKILANN